MIKAEQIYQATNDGLDIIFALYPDAKNCFAKYCNNGNVKKHFAIRTKRPLPAASKNTMPAGR